MLKVDCIIIGSGITGLTVSLRLADLGIKCILIDKSNLNNFKAGETLSPFCCDYFNELGIDVHKKSYCVEYLTKKVKWDFGTSDATISLVANNSCVVDRILLEKNLAEESVKKGNLLLLNTKVVSVSHLPSAWSFLLNNENKNSTVEAKLVLIATGRTHYKLVPESNRNYFDKLLAYSIIKPVLEETNIRQMHVEAVKYGWLYSNELPGNMQIFTAFTDSDLRNKVDSREKELEILWSQSSDKSIPKFVNMKEHHILIFDSRTYWTTIQSGKGWLSLGDAAFSIDPLSGLGIEKNLRMINLFLLLIYEFIRHEISAAKEYTFLNKVQFNKYNTERINEYKKAGICTNKFWVRRQSS